jgi:hypothetical protein
MAYSPGFLTKRRRQRYDPEKRTLRHTLHSRIHTRKRRAQAEESDLTDEKADGNRRPEKIRFYPILIRIDP